MPTNDFLPFATGTGANVTDQAAWSSATDRLTGFQAGTASSAKANKALRQSSSMASMLGQFIADFSGQNAADDGNASNLQANFRSAIAADVTTVVAGVFAKGSLIARRLFPSTGTYTPTAGTNSIRVTCIGAGGGGGGCAATGSGVWGAGGGGAGGGTEVSIITSGFSSVSMTVGGGGNGGGGSASGGTGGTTSFGAFLSAPGGTGGNGSPGASTAGVQAGGTGGLGTTGTFSHVQGGPGFPAITNTNLNFVSGAGGSSTIGPGASAIYTGTGSGITAVNYGSGGSGAAAQQNQSAQLGGAGAQGIIIVEEYA